MHITFAIDNSRLRTSKYIYIRIYVCTVMSKLKIS